MYTFIAIIAIIATACFVTQAWRDEIDRRKLAEYEVCVALLRVNELANQVCQLSLALQQQRATTANLLSEMAQNGTGPEWITELENEV